MLALRVVPTPLTHSPAPPVVVCGEGVKSGVIDAYVGMVVALTWLTVEGVGLGATSEWLIVVQWLTLTTLGQEK